MSASKPRLLFYCQHLLGIGHLTRSLAICDSLVEDFEVHFLQGGPDIGKTLPKQDFRHHFLSPLLMAESDSSLYDPLKIRTPEEIFSERRIFIEDLLQTTSFDVVITELFPFGRNKFKPEVLHLLDRARAKNPQVYVACSIRDILVEKKDSPERDLKMARLVEGHYDAVLVHSDPQILRLEETFSKTSSIQEKLCYTGFVTEARKTTQASARRKEILISMGGGVVGDEMVLAVLRTLPDFPDYLFRVVPGPYASEELKAMLARESAKTSQLRIEAFLQNFEEELSQVSLSISLAGYNTMMNILNTKTPALVYPYMANIEQNLRATRMEAKGLLAVLYDTDLHTESLVAKMKSQLQQKPVDFEVALAGSEQTSKILLRKIKERLSL